MQRIFTIALFTFYTTTRYLLYLQLLHLALILFEIFPTSYFHCLISMRKTTMASQNNNKRQRERTLSTTKYIFYDGNFRNFHYNLYSEQNKEMQNCTFWSVYSLLSVLGCCKFHHLVFRNTSGIVDMFMKITFGFSKIFHEKEN